MIRRSLAMSIVIVAVIIATQTVVQRPALAICRMPHSPEEAVASADAVFKGRVAAIVNTDNPTTATLDVERVWKGSLHVHKRVDVTSGPSNPYAIDFNVGQSYLVFGTEDSSQPDIIQTDVCHGTANVVESKDALNALGDPYIPDSGSSRLLIANFAIGILVVFGILAVYHHRRTTHTSAAER
jgi:hypothetical protein